MIVKGRFLKSNQWCLNILPNSCIFMTIENYSPFELMIREISEVLGGLWVLGSVFMFTPSNFNISFGFAYVILRTWTNTLLNFASRVRILIFNSKQLSNLFCYQFYCKINFIHLDFAFHSLLALQYFQNLHKS